MGKRVRVYIYIHMYIVHSHRLIQESMSLFPQHVERQAPIDRHLSPYSHGCGGVIGPLAGRSTHVYTAQVSLAPCEEAFSRSGHCDWFGDSKDRENAEPHGDSYSYMKHPAFTIFHLFPHGKTCNQLYNYCLAVGTG